MGCGTGAGCWRRLRDWQQTGVWDRLHAVLLAKPRAAGNIDFSLPRGRRLIVDSCGWGGRKTGPNPTDRARPRPKPLIAIDTNGTPIAAIPTGANRNDVTQRVPLIEAIAPIGGVRERPSAPSPRVHAGRGYDHGKYRRIQHERDIPTSIARRGHPHGSGLEKPVGSSSVLMLGCIISAIYVFALNVAPTFTKRSPNSAVARSAGIPCGKPNSLYETVS